MKLSMVRSLACVSVLVIGATMVCRADETGIASPKAKHSKIVAPFNLLPDLTDDQKAKIHDIHVKELEQEKLLREQEHDAIEALLSDEQKNELGSLLTKLENEKKMLSAKHRAKLEEEKADALKGGLQMFSPSTQPSGQ